MVEGEELFINTQGILLRGTGVRGTLQKILIVYGAHLRQVCPGQKGTKRFPVGGRRGEDGGHGT